MTDTPDNELLLRILKELQQGQVATHRRLDAMEARDDVLHEHLEAFMAGQRYHNTLIQGLTKRVERLEKQARFGEG